MISVIVPVFEGERFIGRCLRSLLHQTLSRDKYQIRKQLKLNKIELKETLEESVKEAFRLAEKGDIILFSPGCASFDMFKNYIERGNKFKSIVNNLDD